MAASSTFDVSDAYFSFLRDEPDAGQSAAAIKALTNHIKSSGATTMMGLREGLKEAGEVLSRRPDAPMSIASPCELFVRSVTKIALSHISVESDFERLKQLLIERGEMLARTTLEARSKIARAGAAFIEAGGIVLTLGFSRCVVGLLLNAAKTKHFSVIVAESHPQGDGHQTAAALRKGFQNREMLVRRIRIIAEKNSLCAGQGCRGEIRLIDNRMINTDICKPSGYAPDSCCGIVTLSLIRS